VGVMTATCCIVCGQLQSCTHVFVNIDSDIAYDDPLLEVIISPRY